MWTFLLLYACCYADGCQADIASWARWSTHGYVGLGDILVTHIGSFDQCKVDGSELLVYKDSDNLNDVICELVSETNSLWVRGDDGSGNCNYLLVFGGGAITQLTTTCDSSKKFLCFRPLEPVKSTAELVTTDPVTSEAITTVTPTTTLQMATSTNATSIVSTSLVITTTHLHDEITTSLNNNRTNLFPGLQWNIWIPWTQCTVSCDTGTRFRLKLCASDKTIADNCSYNLGILDNVTISYATEWDVTCNSHPCPVWSEWTQWTECSATCEQGTTRRYRKCLSEELDAFKCIGQSYEMDFCNPGTCPVYVPAKPPEEKSFKEADRRPSAIGIGSMSLIFVLIELVITVLMDSVTISMQCRYLKRNLRHLSRD